MNDSRTLFRRVYDALLEGRSRQAQREIDAYLKARETVRGSSDQVAAE